MERPSPRRAAGIGSLDLGWMASSRVCLFYEIYLILFHRVAQSKAQHPAKRRQLAGS